MFSICSLGGFGLRRVGFGWWWPVRLVGFGLSVVLVVAGLVTVPSSAAALRAADVPVLVSDLDVFSDDVVRGDGVSAFLAAKALGVGVEDLSRRTPVSRVLVEPDGRLRVDRFAAPVWAETGPGVWESIDLDLEPVPAGGFEPRVAGAGVHVSGQVEVDDSGVVGLASMTGLDSSGRSVSLMVGWEGDLPVPVVDGTSVVFPGAASDAVDLEVGGVQGVGADLEVVVERSGFSHYAVLDGPVGGGVVLRYPLVMSQGLEARIAGSGVIEVVDGAGGVVFRADVPVAWDTAPDGGRGVVTPLSVDLVGGVGEQVLVLGVDGGWLDSSERVFPVTVDPVWEVELSDQWARVTRDGDEGWGSAVVGSDSDGVASRFFIKVSGLGDGFVGEVEEASVVLWQAGVESCDFDQPRLMHAWWSSTNWWRPGPEWGFPELVEVGEPVVAESVGCDGDEGDVPRQVVFDVTETVQAGYASADTTVVVLLDEAVEDESGSAVLFRPTDPDDGEAWDNGWMPMLSVVYGSVLDPPGGFELCWVW